MAVLALTWGPLSLAARRWSLREEMLVVGGSRLVEMDMSLSGLLDRASRSKLVKIGVPSLGRGVGDEMYAWRFSFRKEGVVGWEQGSCGLKVGVEGGRSSVGGSFWFVLLFFSPPGGAALGGWGGVVDAMLASFSVVSWSGWVVSFGS